MQLLEIFTVHDAKAEAFITPFFLPTDLMAIRTFTDCVNDPQHMFGKHSHDFTLFHLGQFSVSTGTITLNHTAQVLGNGLEFKSKPEHPTEEQLDFVAQEEAANAQQS